MVENDSPRATSGSTFTRTTTRLLGAHGGDPLLVWSLATFETVTIVLVGVLLGHTTGSLSDLLAGLGTVSGLAAFGYLWLLSLVATRWVIVDQTATELASGELRTPLGRGLVGGAIVGSGLLLGAAAVLGVAGLLRGGTPQPLSILLILGIATAFSLIVGAVVGLSLSVVIVILVKVAPSEPRTPE